MKIVISYWQDSFYCKNYLLKKIIIEIFKKIAVPIIIIIVVIIIIYWPIQHLTPPQKLNLWTFNNLIYSYLQIAMISPGMSCCEHTLNTLRYADRSAMTIILRP